MASFRGISTHTVTVMAASAAAFGISLAVMWPKHVGDSSAPAPHAAIAPKEISSAGQESMPPDPQATASPLPRESPPAAMRSAAGDGPVAKSGADADPADQPLPIAVHIRRRRDAGYSAGKIEGDVTNVSSTPLSLTMVDVNPKTQQSIEWHIELNPGDTKAFGADSGFDPPANDQLTLRSPGYIERSFRVP